MSSLRDELRRLMAQGEESLAVDVLAASGIRVDHTVPQRPDRSPVDTTAPTVPAVEVVDEQGLYVTRIPDAARRYGLQEKLGEGGMGVVHLAVDRNLGRPIALKTIPPQRMDPERVARFVSEARITAQLEHPGIVPVHDLFLSPDGEVFYTMKRVVGRGLDDVIEGLTAGDPATRVRYTATPLLQAFLAAAQAVAYAHTRRVVHRDLKPSNIMLGDFGEVLVMDWGVARILDDAPEQLREIASEGVSLFATVDGAMVGSPAYMAPECLRGGQPAGTAADVFSLGVILYEILTLTRPFRAPNVPRLMYLVATQDPQPPSKRAPERDVPPEVEAICLRALARDPQLRYRDAGELVAELRDWLDGVRPRQEADRLVGEGRELMRLFARAASEAEEAEVRLAAMQQELQPWDPIEMKRLVWDAEHHAEETQAAADQVFADAESAFESALSHVGGHREAQEGLADLYWIRFLQAEEAGDDRWRRRWAALIRRYGGERYEQRLAGDGTLSVVTDPPQAEVTLAPMGVVDGRVVHGEPHSLGTTPIQRVPCPMGAFELVLRAQGRRPVAMPVVVRRLQNRRISVRLVPQAWIQPGFLHVPGGAVTLGGDPLAAAGLSETWLEIGDFAIGRFAITNCEYFEFLRQLHASDPEQARARTPRGGGGQRRVPLFEFHPDLAMPFFDDAGRPWRAQQPVVSISLHDARAYAGWRSRRDGFSYRLPTEAEWEKAARGEDRRTFPWGNPWDGSFCVMADSRPDAPELPDVGTVAEDCSPYGIRDLAGTVRDWCEWEPQWAPPSGRFPIRGGSHRTVEVFSRCASRTLLPAEHVSSHVGFRLVQELL